MTDRERIYQRADVKPCPFCGGSNTKIILNGQTWTDSRMSDPVSVSVCHWCEKIPDQPRRMIERIGRDEASAIAAWNMRAGTRLIAAAPDLLAALRALMHRHSDELDAHGPWAEWDDALDAIARATGGEQ
jgi:hypothetical protein